MGLLGLSDNMHIFGCQLRDSQVLFFKQGIMKQTSLFANLFHFYIWGKELRRVLKRGLSLKEVGGEKGIGEGGGGGGDEEEEGGKSSSSFCSKSFSPFSPPALTESG